MTTFYIVAWICLVATSQSHPVDDQICNLEGEVDICPEGMTCQLDASGHPYCHVAGAPVPSSHCRTEDEYESILLQNNEDITSHEECDQFTKFCPDPLVCCRTHHGHRCFQKVKATLLSDDYHGNK